MLYPVTIHYLSSHFSSYIEKTKATALIKKHNNLMNLQLTHVGHIPKLINILSFIAVTKSKNTKN